MTDIAAVFAASLEIIKAHPMAIKAGSLGRGVETFLLTDCGRSIGLRRAGAISYHPSIHPRASEAVSRAKRTVARTIDG